MMSFCNLQMRESVRQAGGAVRPTTAVFLTGPGVTGRTTVGTTLMRKKPTAQCAIPLETFAARTDVASPNVGCVTLMTTVETILMKISPNVVRYHQLLFILVTFTAFITITLLLKKDV